MLKCGGDKKPGQSIALVGKADAKMHVAPSRAIESVGSCDRNRNNTASSGRQRRRGGEAKVNEARCKFQVLTDREKQPAKMTCCAVLVMAWRYSY